MDTKTDSAIDSEPRWIVITRMYDAPRALIWKAWTEAERIKRWWAPHGCTTPFCTVDLRESGRFHFCIRLADGRDIWAIGVYREIVVPERIVYVDSLADADGNPVPPSHYGFSAEHPTEGMVTVTFAEHPRGTLVTLRHDVGTAPFAERDGVEEGWREMLERLGETLADR